MATSEVAICNLALRRLGADPITALTDNTDRARACALAYPDTRDRLLDEIRPNFAVLFLGLAQVVAVPLYGYGHAYQLPPTVVRVLDIDEEEDWPWSRQGSLLLTDKPAVNARCVVRVTDPTQCSPLFTAALVCQLAADLAFSITKNHTLEQEKKAEAAREIAKAQAAEGAEGSTRVLQDDTLQQARR